MAENFYQKLKKIFFKKQEIFPVSHSINVSTKMYIGNHRNIQIDIDAYVDIDDGVIIREFFNMAVLKNAKLKIGKKVFFNNYCSINCVGSITIGDNTLFGEGVKIYDHNHTYTFNGKLNVDRENFTVGEVIIGENCWIGSGVTILKGVTIGDNVIVGANSLIHKSIPQNSIVRERAELLLEHFE